MSKPLYYQDLYLNKFTTNIINQEFKDGNYHLILEETAFYPEAGGMLADKGTINDQEVIAVYKEDNQIVHVVANEIKEKEVTGIIDMKMRIMHVQEHDAQHLVSAIFKQDFQAQTMSHHVHENTSDIVLKADEMNDEILKAVEEKANRLIFEQTPIDIFEISKAQLADYNLKDNPKYVEPIRIANITALNDYNACGCLHFDNLSHIQAIKFLSFEKNKDVYTVYYTAGSMLLNYLNVINTNMNKLKVTLKANDENIITKMDNLLSERNNLRQDLNNVKQSLYEKMLPELVNDGFIIYHEPSNNFEDIKKLAFLVNNYEQPIVAFLQIQNGDKYQFILAKQKDSDFDLGSVFNKLKSEFEIKGGGSNTSFNGQIDVNLESLIKKYLL